MRRGEGQDLRAPQPHLERRVLHERLAAAAYSRVCVVIAAAGWGKSAAVRSWPVTKAAVRSGRNPTDPEGFAADLAEALRRYVTPPPDLPDPRAAAGDPAGYGAAVCDALRASMREHLVLVVDDFHELPPDGGAVSIVKALCRHAPEQLHLALVSRRELPFSLARLRGQGLVTEIHAPELAFDSGEVAELLRAAIGDCPPELAWLVWERTDGWPAATWLAVQALRVAGADERIDTLARLVRPGERLYDYLREEVLDAEPEPVALELRRLAVFGTVTRATAAAGTAALLAELTRRGLALRAPGGPDRWSLVAPLRDYFDQEPAIPATERAALHRLAAAECIALGVIAQALRHSVAAGDHETCAALLVEHGDRLIGSGQLDAVLDAVDLPAGLLGDPAIQRLLGRARQVRGQWLGAHECFRRAGRDQDAPDPALAWRLGMIDYSKAEFGKVLELPGRTRFGDGDDPEEAQLMALVGAARRMVGDYAGSRADADRALDIARRCADSSALAAGYAVLSAVASAEGDRRCAAEHSANALEAAAAGEDLFQELRTRMLRTTVLAECGQLREALAEAEAVVELAHRCQDVMLVAQARTARASVRLRLGIFQPALADYGAARDLLQRIGSRLLAWPLCGLGDLHRMRGQLARARAAYEEALALAEPCHDVQGMGSALVGLARVRAADDPAAALALAERAVRLGEGQRRVPALLTRGWVAAVAGSRQAAAADASRAAAAARQRRDDPGLAEALVLEALCSYDPARRDRALNEAIGIWQETGCRVQEAVARLVASRIGSAASELGTAVAIETLRAHDIELSAPRPAGPLAVLANTAPSVSISALGVFQVARDGVPVPRTEWRSKKARQLLKILVARRRPVPREQLMELLWPDADPVKAGNRLSVLLSALRDVLRSNLPGSNGPRSNASRRSQDPADSGPLVTDGSAVWLDRTMIDVDVERFLHQAIAAFDAHRHRREDALEQLVTAEAAHTGEFLEDDPYQEWGAALAEEVRATHIALLRALVLRLRRAGETDEVVRYALRLLAKDPYDEPTHLDLVDALRAAGRHGEARRRHDLYMQAMAELGIVPRPLLGPQRGPPRRPR